jgi:MbtH protein
LYDAASIGAGARAGTKFRGGGMTAGGEDDARLYTVVINTEEQYSIWPNGKAIPKGWRSAGKEGQKSECLAYIDEVWRDMRPLGLRRASETKSSEQDTQ